MSAGGLSELSLANFKSAPPVFAGTQCHPQKRHFFSPILKSLSSKESCFLRIWNRQHECANLPCQGQTPCRCILLIMYARCDCPEFDSFTGRLYFLITRKVGAGSCRNESRLRVGQVNCRVAMNRWLLPRASSTSWLWILNGNKKVLSQRRRMTIQNSHGAAVSKMGWMLVNSFLE